MPMKTVDNRTNAPLLDHDHVGVINETAKLACEERHTWGTQRYPALMANAAGLLRRVLETCLFI